MQRTFRRHRDNWQFTHHYNNGETLTFRVFIDISVTGMVTAVTRTLDGGLLRMATGFIMEDHYYTRQGRLASRYAVKLANGRYLDFETGTRHAAYRLADYVISQSSGYIPLTYKENEQ